MPDLSYYTSLFHRAAKEEIGIAVEFEGDLSSYLTGDQMPSSRPKGFEDYTVLVPGLPRTIFIVKPGVRLD